MVSTYLDNPAGRLHALLMELYFFGQKNPGQVNAASTGPWAQVLTPDYGPESPEFSARQAEVLLLPRQIREAVAGLNLDDEDEKEALVAHLGEIETALTSLANRSQQLGNTLLMFAPGGDVPRSAAMYALGSCSRALHRFAAERQLTDEELAAIQKAVEALHDQVVGADLDADIRRLLMRHIGALLAAVKGIRISGSMPLEETTDALIGAIRRRPSVMARLKQTPHVVKAIIALITTVNQGITAGRELEHWTQEAIKMLT